MIPNCTFLKLHLMMNAEHLQAMSCLSGVPTRIEYRFAVRWPAPAFRLQSMATIGDARAQRGLIGEAMLTPLCYVKQPVRQRSASASRARRIAMVIPCAVMKRLAWAA